MHGSKDGRPRLFHNLAKMLQEKISCTWFSESSCDLRPEELKRYEKKVIRNLKELDLLREQLYSAFKIKFPENTKGINNCSRSNVT